MLKSEKIPMENYPGWVQIVETVDDNRRTIHHYEKDGYIVVFVPALGGWVVLNRNTEIFKFRNNAMRIAEFFIEMNAINEQYEEELKHYQ